jgi:uncharacterized membrane protein YuzA (DUF378 family)
MLPAQIRGSPLVYVLLLVVVVAALNWLLVGLLDFDLVVLLTYGKQPKTKYDLATRAVYVVVGAAGLALVAAILMQK